MLSGVTSSVWHPISSSKLDPVVSVFSTELDEEEDLLERHHWDRKAFKAKQILD